MAKRKTPKAKDLRPEKIHTDQLTAIQDIVKVINKAQFELGAIESQKHSVLHGIINEQEKLSIIRNEIKTKYGTENINFEDGTIMYEPNEQVN